MDTQNQSNRLYRFITDHIPTYIWILFILQPLMDILSYWVQRLGMGNALTLILRFGVLGVTALLGFTVSKKKRLYLSAAVLCGMLWTAHTIVCISVGYLNPITDLTNYIRVLQMPLFVFCLISCLRANAQCYRAVELGLVTNYWLITASVVLGLITGTGSPTYEYSGLGILGWFSTTNAQSSIISLLVPIVICLSFCKKKYPLFLLTLVTGFVQLYFNGTRLAFLSIGVTVAGILLIMLLTRKFSVAYALPMVVCGLVCLAFIRQSPMYLNQNQYAVEMNDKQSVASQIITDAEQQSPDSDPVSTKAERLEALRRVYRTYTPGLCNRFGVDRVMEQYDYSYSVPTISGVRRMKINYCELLLDELPVGCRIFGLELDRLTYRDFVYDVENDFHGILYLYGWAGLAAMIAFLGYFIVLIIRYLIRDFKRYFTVEAGAFGIALCLSLVYAYFTAGVLRRPNSSFYLSVVLAVAYYLLRIRKYPDQTEQQQLSDAQITDDGHTADQANTEEA